MHSAVCVYIPLVTSIINIIKSMIAAPAITDLMNEAWPGQSTIVTYKYLVLFSSINIGLYSSKQKLEKPISIVMPFSWL